MSILINGSDPPRTTAYNIYNQLEVNASIDVYGWAINEISQLLSPLGDLVLEELRYWDDVANIAYFGKTKKKMRKYKYEPKAIGGPLAHKIFKFNKVVLDNVPRVTIWRIQ